MKKELIVNNCKYPVIIKKVYPGQLKAYTPEFGEYSCYSVGKTGREVMRKLKQEIEDFTKFLTNK